MEKLRNYYNLTKPGIIRGNTLAVIAGFLFASHGTINGWLFLWTILGSALVMAGGCVLNNFIDRDIDKKMSRTEKRAIVSGTISPISALIYGATLALAGFITLYNFTNNLTVYVGLFGFIFYVYIYAYFKRKTEHGTLVGSISGAIPPVVGYSAVSGKIDTGAILIFLILVVWQMPHFYAIAIFRAKEYASARVPLLSITRGNKVTKRYVLTYMLLFIVVSLMPFFYDLLGQTYLLIMLSGGLYWAYVAIVNYNALSDERWARKVFGTSLIVLLLFCLSIFLDTTLL